MQCQSDRAGGRGGAGHVTGRRSHHSAPSARSRNRHPACHTRVRDSVLMQGMLRRQRVRGARGRRRAQCRVCPRPEARRGGRPGGAGGPGQPGRAACRPGLQRRRVSGGAAPCLPPAQGPSDFASRGRRRPRSQKRTGSRARPLPGPSGTAGHRLRTACPHEGPASRAWPPAGRGASPGPVRHVGVHPGCVFCAPHGSVCSPVTQHMRELLERNSKKTCKLRKKPKPYVEDPDGRASLRGPRTGSAQLCSRALATWPPLSNRFRAGGRRAALTLRPVASRAGRRPPDTGGAPGRGLTWPAPSPGAQTTFRRACWVLGGVVRTGGPPPARGAPGKCSVTVPCADLWRSPGVVTPQPHPAPRGPWVWSRTPPSSRAGPPC